MSQINPKDWKDWEEKEDKKEQAKADKKPDAITDEGDGSDKTDEAPAAVDPESDDVRPSMPKVAVKVSDGDTPHIPHEHEADDEKKEGEGELGAEG